MHEKTGNGGGLWSLKYWRDPTQKKLIFLFIIKKHSLKRRHNESINSTIMPTAKGFWKKKTQMLQQILEEEIVCILTFTFQTHIHWAFYITICLGRSHLLQYERLCTIVWHILTLKSLISSLQPLSGIIHWGFILLNTNPTTFCYIWYHCFSLTYKHLVICRIKK